MVLSHLSLPATKYHLFLIFELFIWQKGINKRTKYKDAKLLKKLVYMQNVSLQGDEAFESEFLGIHFSCREAASI